MGWRLANLANVAVRDTFGQSVSYTPQVGQPYSFTAVRDERHESQTIGQSQVTESMRTITLTVRLADMTTTPQQGDTLTTDGADYEVRDVQNDGQGGAVLVLIETD